MTLSGKETLALLLYLPGQSEQMSEPIIGTTRLVQTIFLLEQEVQGISWALPAFEAYDYGPYSPTVLSDVDTLHTLQVLSISSIPALEPFDILNTLNDQIYRFGRSGIVKQQYMKKYALTSDRGMGFCDAMLLPRLTEAQIHALTAFKSRCNGVSLNTLVRYVASRYPQFTTDSKIRDRVLTYNTLSDND
jgi:hypothetical protein